MLKSTDNLQKKEKKETSNSASSDIIIIFNELSTQKQKGETKIIFIPPFTTTLLN